MIHISDKGSLREIVMSHTERRNALTHAMYIDMTQALEQANNHPACHAIILSGAEGHFTAGNDLNEFLDYDPSTPHAGIAFLHALADLEIPIIAAIEGQAIGIGVTMLQHCDFVLAGSSANFRIPFVPLGLCPEGASSLLLADLVGSRKATQWLLTGQSFNAQEALTAGLLTQIVDDGCALDSARTLAQQLAALPTASVRMTKFLMQEAKRERIHHCIDKEWELFRQFLQSEETRKRILQFFECKQERGPAGESGEL